MFGEIEVFCLEHYGIEWNEEFVANLGYHSDNDLFMTIGRELMGLLESGKTPSIFSEELETEKRGKKEEEKKEGECGLMEPAVLIEPFFEPIIKIYEDLFDELHGTTVTATASFGVKLCYEYESGLCFGGGFGFAVNGQRQGFLYRESVLDAVDNINKVQMDLIPNGRGKREPASTEQPIRSTQSTPQSPTQSTETTHSTQQSSMPSQPAEP